MTIKLLSSAIIGVTLATSSFASPLLSNFGSKEHLKTQSVQEITGNNYTDFTGEWKGKCSGSNMEQEQELTIKNDLFNFIFINEKVNVNLDINGLSNKAMNIDGEAGGEVLSVRWNDDRSALLINGIKFAQRHNASAAGPLLSILMNAKINMENNTLIFEDTEQAFADGSRIRSMHVTCTFTKK